MIFLRLASCPLRCIYCDEPEALVETEHASIIPIEGEPYNRANPLTPEQTVALIEQLHYPTSLLSLTGGEPLHQATYLHKLLPPLKSKGYILYLETAGVYPEKLFQLLPQLDFVSLDWKLAEHLAHTASCTFPAQTLKLLVKTGKPYQLKLVLTPDLTHDSLDMAFSSIASIDSKTNLILQPVSPSGSVKKSCSPQFLQQAYFLASRTLSSVRLIPQIHKTLNLP